MEARLLGRCLQSSSSTVHQKATFLELFKIAYIHCTVFRSQHLQKKLNSNVHSDITINFRHVMLYPSFGFVGVIQQLHSVYYLTALFMLPYCLANVSDFKRLCTSAPLLGNSKLFPCGNVLKKLACLKFLLGECAIYKLNKLQDKNGCQ